MNGELRASDLLCGHWIEVATIQRYRDVVRDSKEPVRAFVVLDESGRFMGLVEERQAALFPGRIFADLLVKRPPKPLSAEAPVKEVLDALDHAHTLHLPVVDAQGECIGVTSHTCLFSVLLAREQKLREEREALIAQLQDELHAHEIASAVFNATSEGIMVTDAEQRIISVNRAFTQTTGYAPREALGHTPSLLSSGRHGAEYYGNMWQQLQAHGRWEGEIWNRRKNGDVYPEWLHVDAIRDETGRITNFVGVFSDITKHKELRDRLHILANYDSLTGLPNRALFLERLRRITALAGHRKFSFSLLCLGLDRFREINDTYGHNSGDQVLVEIGKRLQGCLRESDDLARLEGDEFVILSEGGEVNIHTLAQRLLHALERPIPVDQESFFVSASLGICHYPDDGADADTLLASAHSALFQAKTAGKGGFSLYSPDAHERARQRVRRVADLREALENDRLELAWQPQVSLEDGRVTGLEALARWPRDDGQPISPAEFIPLAEQSGLILHLGRWVIDTAISEARTLLQTWPALQHARFALNLSPCQLDESLPAMLTERLARAGLPSDCLEVEITESALFTDQAGVTETLNAIGSAGIRLAVDDFGTGYSNIARLKLLPIHRLKLDRSFIADLEHDPGDRELVRALLAMARALDLDVIAEGVETRTQADFLARNGCPHAQGYLYARPQPLAPLKSWLRG
ncbi:PAS domain S-box-containing protein/diguanylate cyclase (GGDEF)-like protein [Alkalispirillum mobile]|uniref:PAS domain S-box-containing protein/diguanylate cyclase (GGDEF)-like protein n=1 Tax=Alkalispirillum mobile TaxID=85925 RepID=A0A498C4X0_9GAMM|nr:EAL domain-containing protein [Alkalispirillum mobile]RLK51214.1 PAS domain S-box-containing protein/diguanylate cyclase (GGDEF)-like protein [Alkalispirillum mobile]